MKRSGNLRARPILHPDHDDRGGSGHPTVVTVGDGPDGRAAYSAERFRYDIADPQHPNNEPTDLFQGHALALCTRNGRRPARYGEHLATYRKSAGGWKGTDGALSLRDAATGSLGQGPRDRRRNALNAKYLDRLPYRTYVLLATAKWRRVAVEAAEIAAFYKLDNLSHPRREPSWPARRDDARYDSRPLPEETLGIRMETILIDGHFFPEYCPPTRPRARSRNRPTMIIARTVKGKGVSFLENREGWHGRTLKPGRVRRGGEGMGEVDKPVRGKIAMPENRSRRRRRGERGSGPLRAGENGGNAGRLRQRAGAHLPGVPGPGLPRCRVSNSTKRATFKEARPERSSRCYIAEQKHGPRGRWGWRGAAGCPSSPLSRLF